MDRYREALALVFGANKVSCSFIQRTLGIGYNEAARFIERMESDGLVGKANNVGRREMLAKDLRQP